MFALNTGHWGRRKTWVFAQREGCKTATVLLIDDDAEVLAIAEKYLAEKGFAVLSASQPAQGLRLAQQHTVHCVVLDIMMPGLDGFEVCRRIRQFSQVPVLFLSGKSAEEDRVAGLTLGADDYIVKPFSLPELKARIDIAVRRGQPAETQPPQPQTVFCHGALRVDLLAHQAFYRNEDLRLTQREFEVLCFFCLHPDEDIPFEVLGQSLFGSYRESDRNAVMVQVSRLRKKMGGHAPLQRMIETVWSRGYRFTP